MRNDSQTALIDQRFDIFKNIADPFFRRHQRHIFRQDLINKIRTICILLKSQSVDFANDIVHQHETV